MAVLCPQYSIRLERSAISNRWFPGPTRVLRSSTQTASRSL